MSGLAEALQHLERVLQLWEEVPGAEELTALALPDVLGKAAELADLTGNGQAGGGAHAPRDRARRRRRRPLGRVGLLYERLGSYLLPWGAREAAWPHSSGPSS